jgi:hypothetical protein
VLSPSSIEWGRSSAQLFVGTALSAGLTLVPYYLLLKPTVEGVPIANSTAASTAVFAAVFAAIPLAVTRVQTAIQNGSDTWVVDNWAPAIAAVGAEALVMTVFFATRSWKPVGDTSVVTEGVVSGEGSQPFLLVGTIALVPALTTLLIHLMKSPRVLEGRMSTAGSLLHYDPREGLAAGLPSIAPFAGTRGAGAQLSLFSGSL